jgi:cytochrome c5
MRHGVWLVVCALPLAAGASVTAQTQDNGKAAAVKEAADPDKKPAAKEPAVVPVRGQQLYENHCTSCHESTVYIRERRRAKTFADVRGWTVHWSKELKLNWGQEEVDDVVRYLNGQFYRYAPGTK